MSRFKSNSRFFILLLFLMALPLEGVWAQEFNLGVFGGVTVAQVDGDYYRGYHKLGMTGGLFVNREIDNNFYWQLELKYVSRGAFENEPTSSIYDKTVFRYLEIPVLVYYLYEKKYQFDLGISPEVLLQYAHFDANGKTDPSLYPPNNRIGLSVFAGFSYWFVPNTAVGFRFTYSAITFRDPQEWNNPQNRGMFHNVLAFTVAHKFKAR
jgi:hypothetical protein